MNKSTRIGVALLALALAYPASALFLGWRVRAGLSDQYQKLEEHGVFKVASRYYEQGLFKSTETVTLELTPGFRSALKAALVGVQPAAPAIPDQALQVTIHSEIQHGPVPAGQTVGAALISSELVLNGDAKAAIEKLMGGAKPISVQTRYGFFGGGLAHVTSPSLQSTFKTEKGESIQVAWDGIVMDVDFSRKMRHYTMQLAMPKLEIKNGDGSYVQFSNLQAHTDAERILGDDSQLYAGTSQFDLDSVDMKIASDPEKTFKLGKLSLRGDMPFKDGFVDVAAKFGIEVLKVGEQDYGPVRYHVSVQHMQAQALDQMQRIATKSYATAFDLTAQKEATQMAAAMHDPLIELLKQKPVVRLDLLQFRNKHGEAQATGEFKLGQVSTEDFANPLLLAQKADLKAEIKLPQLMAASLMSSRKPPLPEGAEEPSEAQLAEEAAMREKMALDQLQAFATQGFIERSGESLIIKFAFNNGQILLNGKPMGATPTQPPPAQ